MQAPPVDNAKLDRLIAQIGNSIARSDAKKSALSAEWDALSYSAEELFH
jgi:hypothetical protein